MRRHPADVAEEERGRAATPLHQPARQAGAHAAQAHQVPSPPHHHPRLSPAPPRRLHRAHRCVCVVACCRRAARSASRSTRPTTSPPPTTRSPRSTVSRHTSHDTRHVPHHYINTCLQANCDIHYTTILRPSQCRPFNNVIRLPSANICEHYTIQI